MNKSECLIELNQVIRRLETSRKQIADLNECLSTAYDAYHAERERNEILVAEVIRLTLALGEFDGALIRGIS